MTSLIRKTKGCCLVYVEFFGELCEKGGPWLAIVLTSPFWVLPWTFLYVYKRAMARHNPCPCCGRGWEDKPEGRCFNCARICKEGPCKRRGEWWKDVEVEEEPGYDY